MSEPETSAATRHAAVVLTVSPTGLAVARSLAPRGVKVWGVDSNRLEIGHFSRWFIRDPRIAYEAAGPQLLAGLLALGREQPALTIMDQLNEEGCECASGAGGPSGLGDVDDHIIGTCPFHFDIPGARGGHGPIQAFPG